MFTKGLNYFFFLWNDICFVLECILKTRLLCNYKVYVSMVNSLLLLLTSAVTVTVLAILDF